MTAADITTRSTLEFLAALFAPDDIVEFRCILPGATPDVRQKWCKARDAAQLVQWCERLNRDGFNIYVGVNPRNALGATGDRNIVSAHAIFADFDRVALDDALGRVEAAKLPVPSIVVMSGHGVHFYWLINEHFQNLDIWTAFQKDLIAALNSDKSIHNPERIMRLCGYTNHKAPSALCELLKCDTSSVYEAHDLLERIPSRQRDAERPHRAEPSNGNGRHNDSFSAFDRCMKYTDKMPAAISGQRGHAATLAAACEAFRFGLSRADARAILDGFNSRCQPAWSDRELAHKIDDAEKKVRDAGEFGVRLKDDRPQNGPSAKRTPSKSPTDVSLAARDRATELANAEELFRRHGNAIRWHIDRGEYFTYSKTHWQSDADGQVQRWAKEIARESTKRLRECVEFRELVKFQKIVESARGINGVLRLLQTESGISVAGGQFDRDEYLLNLANGTLDLRTLRLREHEPADMLTHCLSTPYNVNAKCPLWNSVVRRSMAGDADLIGYLRRWCGLFLTGSPNTHELLIAHGVGANGKSVIFDTLCGLLESLAGIAPESLLTPRHGQNEHPTEIADVFGKRLVVASETESGATLRLQLVKRLTGDSMIKARYMRQDFFEFRRTHKLVLITNNRPRLTENTEAVWRRLRLLPFNVVIPPSERDPNLLEKLKAERAGILAWCVRGCIEQQREGMNPPAAVLVATDEYRADADELADFVQARCIVGESDIFRVSRSDLHTAYVAWARENNERHAMDRNQFYEAIRRREGVSEGSFKVNNAAIRGFKGIGLVAKQAEGCR